MRRGFAAFMRHYSTMIAEGEIPGVTANASLKLKVACTAHAVQGSPID